MVSEDRRRAPENAKAITQHWAKDPSDLARFQVIVERMVSRSSIAVLAETVHLLVGNNIAFLQALTAVRENLDDPPTQLATAEMLGALYDTLIQGGPMTTPDTDSPRF
jgi:hypothetical protein